MSNLTREQAEDTIEGLEGLISRGIQSAYLDMALSGMRQLLAAMDSEPVEPIWRATKYPVSRPVPGAKLIVWDETGKFVGYGSAVDTRDSGVAIQMSDGRRLDSNHDLRWQYALQQPVLEREQVRREHAEWAQATFGNTGPVGPLKHLSAEALEAAAAPDDHSEWADMQFLFWDAQRKAGISDEQITQAMVAKLQVNKARQWPEPKEGEPRFHIKDGE